MVKPRDTAKPVEHYERVIERHKAERETLQQAIERTADPQRRAKLLNTFPQKANDMALAAYSAGKPIAECKRWLGEAVDARLRIAELSGYRFPEYGFAHEDWRTFSGAYLIGRHAELVAAHRKTVFETQPVPGLLDLMEQYCEVLLHEPLARQADERSLKPVAPDWLTLPPLFQAVAARDQARFAATLETYLSTTWELYAVGLKRAIKQPGPFYFGVWNLLSAALAKIMGGVPNLSAKSRAYVPTELIAD